MVNLPVKNMPSEPVDQRSQDPGETIAKLRRLHRKMSDLRPLDDEKVDRAKNEGRS